MLGWLRLVTDRKPSPSLPFGLGPCLSHFVGEGLWRVSNSMQAGIFGGISLRPGATHAGVTEFQLRTKTILRHLRGYYAQYL
jgi:hypothetical protein